VIGHGKRLPKYDHGDQLSVRDLSGKPLGQRHSHNQKNQHAGEGMQFHQHTAFPEEKIEGNDSQQARHQKPDGDKLLHSVEPGDSPGGRAFLRFRRLGLGSPKKVPMQSTSRQTVACIDRQVARPLWLGGQHPMDAHSQ